MVYKTPSFHLGERSSSYISVPEDIPRPVPASGPPRAHQPLRRKSLTSVAGCSPTSGQKRQPPRRASVTISEDSSRPVLPASREGLRRPSYVGISIQSVSGRIGGPSSSKSDPASDVTRKDGGHPSYSVYVSNDGLQMKETSRQKEERGTIFLFIILFNIISLL
jgi:hypothetical protein